MNYLPQKKTTITLIALGVAVLLIITAYFLPSIRDNDAYSDEDTVIATSPVSATSSATRLEQDTDNDGLKDWEEGLWKTDPTRKDTDFDNTSDGEEVQLGRNPLVAGPNDDLNTSEGEPFSTTTTQTKNLSATDLFARDFFTKYLQLKKTGATLDDESAEQLVASIIGDSSFISSIKTAVTLYTTTDLEIMADSSAGSLRKYGNSAGKAILAYPPEGENELVIMRRALETQNAKELEKLTLIADSYAVLTETLVQMPVPKIAASMHLKLINGYNQLSKSLKGVQKIYIDPVGALASVGEYQRASEEIFETLREGAILFEKNAVTFTQNEEGYVFTASI